MRPWAFYYPCWVVVTVVASTLAGPLILTWLQQRHPKVSIFQGDAPHQNYLHEPQDGHLPGRKLKTGDLYIGGHEKTTVGHVLHASRTRRAPQRSNKDNSMSDTAHLTIRHAERNWHIACGNITTSDRDTVPYSQGKQCFVACRNIMSLKILDSYVCEVQAWLQRTSLWRVFSPIPWIPQFISAPLVWYSFFLLVLLLSSFKHWPCWIFMGFLCLLLLCLILTVLFCLMSGVSMIAVSWLDDQDLVLAVHPWAASWMEFPLLCKQLPVPVWLTCSSIVVAVFGIAVANMDLLSYFYVKIKKQVSEQMGSTTVFHSLDETSLFQWFQVDEVCHVCLLMSSSFHSFGKGLPNSLVARPPIVRSPPRRNSHPLLSARFL